MKALLFTLEYPPFYGGVANYYGNLVKNWPEEGGMAVLHNNHGKLMNNNLPRFKWLPAVFYLWREIRKNKIDHVIVGNILPLGIATFFVSKFLKIRYSVVLHGLDFSLAMKNDRNKKLTRKILRKAENIICVNNYVSQEVCSFIKGDEHKVFVVNPGVSVAVKHILNKKIIDKIIDKNDLSEKIILFSVGRLVARKGFDKTIESLSSVFEKFDNLVYLIAGSGPDKKIIEEKIAKLEKKHQSKIILLGKISDEEKWALMNLCDIFVMPARNIGGDYEGFGIVYLEANLLGKPVIAGRAGGVGDAVVNGVNGLLVDPENVDDIAGAIIKLAENKDIREKMGQAGQLRVIREFDWNSKAKEFYKFIKFK